MDILNLRQGDILRGGRIIYQTGQERVLRKYRKGYGIDRHPSDRRTQVWAMPATLTDMAILTQTCDIRKLDMLALAPVFPINYGLPLQKQDQVRRQRITYLYYMPQLPVSTYPESYMDARIICSVSKSAIADAFTCVRKLPSSYIEHFRRFVFNHLGRPAIPNVILAGLENFLKKAQDAKLRDQIYAIYIDQNVYPFQLLVLLYESSPTAVEKLTQAIDAANLGDRDCQFELDCKIYNNTKLSDLNGYTRLVYDHLSYESPSGLVPTDLDGYSLK